MTEKQTVERKFVRYGEHYAPATDRCGEVWSQFAVADDGTAWTRTNSGEWEQVLPLPPREVTP